MKQKLFRWFEAESEKKSAIYFLAVLAFFESIIFPIPIDIFTFTLTVANPKKWLKFATVATFWSVLGAVFGYLLGAYLFDSFGKQMIDFYGYQDQFIIVTELFNNNIFWVMFVAAFTPIPYKVFTIAGGALRVLLFPFILASILGRGLRFFAETYLAYKFGRKVAQHIMRKVNMYSLIFVIIVITFLIMRSL